MWVLIAALLLGVLVGGRLPDLSAATKKLLRLGVVLLGLQLSLPVVLELGPGVLVAVVATVAVTFLGTRWIGGLLGLPRGLSTLVATGFSICGASAVAAVEGVVERRDEDVATSVALVTLFGTLAMLALPLLGASPLWIGLSVHEVGQVAAAAPASGLAAAMAVKLSRVALLAPVVALVGGGRGSGAPVVPLFLVGFAGLAALRSTGVLPQVVLDGGKVAATVLLAAAMFGLGTAVRPKALLRTGPRALALGALSTLLVCGTGWATLTLLT
ncbi:putative sulfate exporter family transporter [Actinosynnema pretiosum]|uniref:Sulfate exporter family transporter n=1 Tax=Actinosynnema pretiosum TaxID=42197 RepID=A0A290ZD43_9PSEU|nr:putative sulfate exporter family transporter [Actinosynnema pretiosum]